MTQEEKSKAYDEAFERAKAIRFGNPNSVTANVVCEQIFPELKENDGERIEQKIIEIPFGADDSELQEASYHIPKGFHAEIEDDKVVIKRTKDTTNKSE